MQRGLQAAGCGAVSACSVQHCSRGAGQVIVLDIFGPNKAHSLAIFIPPAASCIKIPLEKGHLDNSENNVGCCQLRSPELPGSCSLLHTSKYRAIIAIYILQISLTQARVQPAVTRWGGSTCPGSLHQALMPPTSSEGHCSTCSNHCHSTTVICLRSCHSLAFYSCSCHLFISKSFCGVNLHFVQKNICFGLGLHPIFVLSISWTARALRRTLPVVSRLQYPV